MIGELIYTSARAGLRPGTSGFCTVAATKGLSKRDQLTLESLSGYEFAFGISDPRAASNPTCYLHTTVGSGVAQQVISRVAFAGADHTGRSNKIAHHITLGGSTLPSPGPAALVRHLNTQHRWATKWDEPARELEPWSLPTAFSPASGGAWSKLTGDQGWAGALARAFRNKPNAPAFVVFEPDTDVLGLFEESLALLPPEERWNVCFSTYYTATLPPDRPCHWRGVLAGSPAAALCSRHPGATIVDLTKPLPAPEEDEFTSAARKGQVVSSPVSLVAPAKATKPSRKRRGAAAVSAAEPELVLELQAVEGETSSTRLSFRPGGAYSVAGTKKRADLPAWVYLTAALVLGSAIVLIPSMSRKPPAPPSGVSRSSSRSVEQPTGDSVGLSAPHSPPSVQSPRTGSIGQSSRSRDSLTSASGADSNPAREQRPSDSDSPVTASPSEITSLTRGGIVPLAAPVQVPLQTRLVSEPLPVAHGAAVASVITSTATDLFKWRFSFADIESGWSGVHGRVGTHMKLDSHGGKLGVRIGTREIGVFALEREGRDYAASFRVDPKSEIQSDSSLIRSLVFELEATGKRVLLPVRALSQTRRQLLGYPVGEDFRDAGLLTWVSPSPLEAAGILILYPLPRVHVTVSAEENTVPLPREGMVKGSPIALEVEPAIEGTLAASIEARKCEDLRRCQPTDSELTASIAVVASASKKLRDAHSSPSTALSRRESRARAQRIEAAKKELEDAEEAPSLEWLQDMAELAARLGGAEILLVDAWGLPLDRVRFEWSWGWLAPHVERLNEAKSR